MTDAPYYMACLDLRGRGCLVVGGGRVATEKVHGLLDCDAQVTVVAPHIDDALRRLPVRLVCRTFEPRDVEGHLLVIAATNDRAVNETVSREAAVRSIFCNVADDPDLCSFILPAIVRRDPIGVGVSTGGASPALAQRIRIDEPIVFPVHPRTASVVSGLSPHVQLVPPVGYLDFASLVSQAHAILTDSGGLQKEAYWYGVPCITLRPSTEWVDTVAAGANILVDDDPEALERAVAEARMPQDPPQLYGDGQAARHIAAALYPSRP
jgi:UDP-N-acetylglucosamine 2-epimerase